MTVCTSENVHGWIPQHWENKKCPFARESTRKTRTPPISQYANCACQLHYMSKRLFAAVSRNCVAHAWTPRKIQDCSFSHAPRISDIESDKILTHNQIKNSLLRQNVFVGMQVVRYEAPGIEPGFTEKWGVQNRMIFHWSILRMRILLVETDARKEKCVFPMG